MLPALYLLVGLAAVVAGVTGLLSVWAGLVVLGAGLIALGVLEARGAAPHRDETEPVPTR